MKAIILSVSTSLTFLVVMLITNYWSGWGRLASAYRFHGKFSARQRWTFLSARMGTRKTEPLLRVQTPLFSLRSCLNISVNETGVHLSLFPLFRLFSPPLFVPWGHISAEVSQGVLSKWVEFSFREESGVCLRLSERVGRDVLMYSPTQVLEVD